MPQTSRRTVLAALAAAGAAPFVMTGCSGDDGGGGGGGGSSLITVYNGASGQMANNFNPYSPTAATGARGIIHQTLLFFNQTKAGDIQPVLAKKYTWNDDGTVVTFPLQEGVKWSDGEPFSADDVVFTFDLLRKTPAINTTALPLAGAKALSDTEVEVTFTRPAYTDLFNAAGQTWMLPKHVWSKIKDPATEANTKPIGTGPFVLKSFSPQNYVVAKNPNYWEEGKPSIDGLRFVSYSGNAPALNALIAGQIDWSGIFIPEIDETYADKKKTNNYNNISGQLTVIDCNLERPLTGDLAVRRALYLGMDRDQINKVAFSGYNSPATPGMLILPRDEKWLSPDVPSSTPEADPRGAEKVLQEAGYAKGGDGVYAKDGQRLSLSIKVISGYTDYIAAVQALQRQYAAIGIELKPEQQAPAAFTADRSSGNFDLMMDGQYGGPVPYFLYNNFYNSANTKPIGEQANPNWGRFRSDVVDQALATIGGTNDEDTLKAAYGEIQKVISEQLPYVVIAQAGGLSEFSTAKVTGWPSDGDLYANSAPFAVPDVAIIAARLKPTGN